MQKLLKNIEPIVATGLLIGTTGAGFYDYYRSGDVGSLRYSIGILTGAIISMMFYNWIHRHSQSIIRKQDNLIIEMLAEFKALEMIINKAEYDAKQQAKRKKGRKTVRKTSKTRTTKSKA